MPFSRAEYPLTGQSPDAFGRMNAFQAIMYQWSVLHPYNAAHTYKIAGPLELGKLREAVRETCLCNDIGLVKVAPDGRSYQHAADVAPEIGTSTGGEDADDRLAEHLTRELNRPFARPICRPFRFSAIDAGPDYHYVSATYDHWVADSTAARLVLRHVLGRYCDLDIRENDWPLDLYPGTYRQILGHRLHGFRLMKAAVHTLHQWPKNRSTAEPAYPSPGADGRKSRTVRHSPRHGAAAAGDRSLDGRDGPRRDPGRLGAADGSLPAPPLVARKASRPGPGHHREYRRLPGGFEPNARGVPGLLPCAVSAG